MKVAIVIFTVFGAAIAASIVKSAYPKPRNIFAESINKPNHNDSPQLKIYNGEEVVPHSIPYQVYLEGGNAEETWSCGGSLITPSYVLTAAHCLQNATFVQVTLGAHNIFQPAAGSVTINGTRWIVHEDYNPKRFINDVGLLELDHPITLTETIQLASLPQQDEAWKDLVGESARVSGWGTTLDEPQSDVLLQTNSTVIDNTDCDKAFALKIMSEHVCLQSPFYNTACLGDSGGPMVIDNVQYGIISFGSAFCILAPAVNVRVAFYLDWIMANSDWKP